MKISILLILFIFLICNVCFAEKINGNIESKSLTHEGDDATLYLSQSSIVSASHYVRSYIDKNGRLPNFVTISKNNFSMPEFLYLSAKTISYKASKSNSQVQVNYNIKNPSNPSGNSINIRINKKNYNKLANKIVRFMDKNNATPNHITISSKRIQYQTLVYGVSSILSFNYKNKVLPNYLTLNFKRSSSLNKYIPRYNRFNSSDPVKIKKNSISPYFVQLDSILSASSVVKEYIETHGKLPDFVIVNKKKYSMASYLHSLTQAIGIYVITGSSVDEAVIMNSVVKSPSYPSGSSINGNLDSSEYFDISGRIATFITNHNRAPNFASSSQGNIQYQTIIYALTKVVDHINKNRALPNSISINIKSSDPINQYIPKL